MLLKLLLLPLLFVAIGWVWWLFQNEIAKWAVGKAKFIVFTVALFIAGLAVTVILTQIGAIQVLN